MLCIIFITSCGTIDNSTQRSLMEITNNKSNNDLKDEKPTKNAIPDCVDLTALSSTMVYAEIYNMWLNPDDYLGKTIKIKGDYYTSYYDETGLYYNLVVVGDAASCCQQWLEFIWNGDHIYPDDYPASQTKIELVGVFGTYNELDETYCYLMVDDITVLQ